MPPVVRITSRRLSVWLVRALAAFGAYLIANWAALAFPAPVPFVSLFSPAAGVALLIALQWGQTAVPALAMAALAAALLQGATPLLAALVAVGSTVGPWLSALWIGRRHSQIDRDDRGLTIRRVAVVGLGCSAVIDACNRALWLSVFGPVDASDLPLIALQGWMGNALAVLLIAVPLYTIDAGPWVRSIHLSVSTATVGQAGAAMLTTVWALAMPAQWAALGWGLLAVPPVLAGLMAMRRAAFAASACVLLITIGVFAATEAGFGPFAGLPSSDGPLLMWTYAAALAALVLLPRTVNGETHRLEERWALALEGSNLGVADWHLGSDKGYTSARWRHSMGDPDGSRSASIERWLAEVHPDDRPALRGVLAESTTSTESHHRHEVRITTGAQWRWFAIRLIVARRDAAGRPLRVVASAEDVTARRQSEEERHLSSNLFMNLHEGLLITDADLRVIDANPSYSRITGVARDELIGTVPSLLRSPAHDSIGRAVQASLWAGLRASGSWAGEVVERRRDGNPCAMRLTVSTVRGPEGELRYHVVVVSDVTESRVQRDRLERQANFDELTRLPNRTRLGRLLADAMASADRDGSLLAVCYLDLDHFKVVNARFGAPAGDLLLAETANRLRGALRNRGADTSDTAARLGGDEFAVLLHVRSVDEARAAVERLLCVVAQPVTLAAGADPVAVTASVGATVYPLDASDADTLLRHADHAMYGVKQSGRNGWLFFDPEYSRRTEERVLAIGRVQDALDHHELQLYYQPKVDLRRGSVMGVEALLRWNHPEHGLVPPAHFLPLIENTGLSARIGDHVLASALEQLDAWHAQGLDLTVSVNISARHLQEPDFAQRLAELLARHERPLGGWLELEVLETTALADIDFSSALLAHCGELGVRWALDDFGTGYSTLTYLKRLPVQILKIDRSFVRNMLEDAQDRAIVEGVIGLARTFGCKVVAEGVESAAQGRTLLDLGCEVGQGAGIAGPMPAEAIVGWVREWRGLFTPTPTHAAAGAASAAAPPAPGQSAG